MAGVSPGKGISIDQAETLFRDLFAPRDQQLNLEFLQVDGDETRIRMPLHDSFYRVGKVVSGQTLLGLADSVMVLTISSYFGGYRNMATINQSANFMKPISNADVLATGRLLRVGKTMAFGEVILAAEGGTPAVQVQSAYALLPEMPAQGPSGGPTEKKGTPA